MHEYILGIDGGGSKTDAICFDQDGKVVGKGSSGPLNLSATSLESAERNFLDAVFQATLPCEQPMQFKHVVIGLAGADTSAEVQFAQKIFRNALRDFSFDKFTLVNDIEFVLAAGTKTENAIALISGTGSNCFGRNAKGHTAKTSGMDFLLADEGSGYEVGRMVLRAATQSFDDRGPKTLLEQLVLQHFAASDFLDLKSKIYRPILSKSEVAKLSLVCEEAYQQHDRVAEHIFAQVITDLKLMVETVIRKLEVERQPTEVVCAGSVINLPFVFSVFKQDIESAFPQTHVGLLEKQPILGAWQIFQREK